MDKHIKMLMVKLSPKFKITMTTIMFYNTEKQAFANVVKLRRVRRFDGNVYKIECSGKRAAISEMMTWVND